MLDKYDLYQLLSITCKAPDHLLLTLHFKYTYMQPVQQLTPPNSVRLPVLQRKQYNFNNNPNVFLVSETWKKALTEIVTNIEVRFKYQRVTDDIYIHVYVKVYSKSLMSNWNMKVLVDNQRKSLNIPNLTGQMN